jgi:hypothetical protein
MSIIRFVVSLILGALLGLLIFFAMMTMTGGIYYEFCRDFAVVSGAVIAALFNLYHG